MEKVLTYTQALEDMLTPLAIFLIAAWLLLAIP